MKNYVITLLALPLILGCGSQENADWNHYKQEFNTEFTRELSSKKVVGASYALFDNEKTIWSGNYGYANKEASQKTIASSKFLIGSLTKVFTAVAVMQLCEKGELHLDDPISKHLPAFSIHQRFKDSDPITVRSVLTHHAGLPSDIFIHKFSANPPCYKEVLDYLNSQSTCFPVGKIKSYSNLGYALLGILIEELSGVSYTEYVTRKIINPLQLNNTGFYTSGDMKDELAVSYDRSGKSSVEYPIFDVPAGAIYSTLEDMIKFGQLFIGKNNPVLKTSTIEEMFELQNENIDLDLDDRSAICFNFRNKAFELGRVLEHGGATVYQKAQLYIAPDAKLGAIILSNSPDGVFNAWKLNEQMMPRYLEEINNFPISVNQPGKEVKYTSIKNKNLKKFVGDYAMPGVTCNFEWLNDHLYTSIQNHSFYIVPEDDHSFVPAKRFLGKMSKSKQMWFFLEEINDEKLLIQSMPWGDLVIIGQQVKQQPIPGIWKERIGNYEIINQNDNEIRIIHSMALKEKNGFLILSFTYHDAFGNPTPVEMALDIQDEHQAFVLGLGRNGGESLSFKNSEEHGKTFLSYFGLQAFKK